VAFHVLVVADTLPAVRLKDPNADERSVFGLGLRVHSRARMPACLRKTVGNPHLAPSGTTNGARQPCLEETTDPVSVEGLRRRAKSEANGGAASILSRMLLRVSKE
jgi:hypothetical protein